MVNEDFKNLDNIPKLLLKESKRKRRNNNNLMDAIGIKMAECKLPSEIAELAQKFGVERKEIYRRADKATNSGQFRMIMLNRIRSIIRKLKVAQSLNIKITPQQAAYPDKKLTKTLR